jgi:hypothetical protein
MEEHTNELDELRKIRQAKYENRYNQQNQLDKKKHEYNYDIRKDFISRIKKIVKSEVAKERMDKIEKKEYSLNIFKLSIGDLEYFTPEELKPEFMADLFKYNIDSEVLQYAYNKQSPQYPKPQFLFIKEYITKPKLNENFLLNLIKDYTKNTTNMIQILTTTDLLDTKFETSKKFVLNIFYNHSNTQSISFEQIKLLYSKTEMDVEKFIFLISRCSNKSGYSKCDKTYVERTNINLIKNMIYDMENKFKCKIDIDLYK